MKILKQATYVEICNSKSIRICPNQQADLHRILFIEDYLKIKKGPGTSFQAIFFIEFSDKKIYFVILHKLTKVNYQTLFTSQVFQ